MRSLYIRMQSITISHHHRLITSLVSFNPILMKTHPKKHIRTDRDKLIRTDRDKEPGYLFKIILRQHQLTKTFQSQIILIITRLLCPGLLLSSMIPNSLTYRPWEMT